MDDEIPSGIGKKKESNIEEFQEEILQLQNELVDQKWVGFLNKSTHNPITLICASPAERLRYGLHYGRNEFQPTSAREAISILNRMDYSKYGWDLQVNHNPGNYQEEKNRKEKLMNAFIAGMYPKLLEENTSDHTYRSMQFKFKDAQNNEIMVLKGATWNLQDRCLPGMPATQKYPRAMPANNPWGCSEKGDPKSFEDEKYKARKLKQIDKIINEVISGKDFLFLQEIDFLYKNGQTEKELKKIFEDKLAQANLAYLQTPDTIRSGSQQPLGIIYNAQKIAPVLGGKNNKPVGNSLFLDHRDNFRGYEWKFTRVGDAQQKQFALTNVHLSYTQDYSEDIIEYQKQQAEQNIPTIIGGDTNHPIIAKEIPGALGNPNKATNLQAVNADRPNGKVSRLDHRYENDIYAKLEPKSYDTFFANSVRGGKVIAEELDGECFEFQDQPIPKYTTKKTSLTTTFSDLSDNLKALLSSEKFKDKVKKHAGLRGLNLSSPTLFKEFLTMCDTKKHWSESFGAFRDYVGRDSDIQKLYVLGKKYNASKNDRDIRKFEKYLHVELAEYGNKKGQLSPSELKGTYFSLK